MEIFKFSPFNFVPIEKNPWGGSQISHLKKKYFPNDGAKIPERIGESWEARIDSFLLKWIDAIEPLSIQIHPKNSHPSLKSHECGKPEAWFVQNLNNPTPLYLGFKKNFTQDEIKQCLLSNTPTDCLHSFVPKKHDYISVPTGCVHALGVGILIAEPQYVVPNKEGKTWRISDWNRRYNDKGIRDNEGSLRELHLQLALSAIDWNLPRGKLLEDRFVKNLRHGDRFLGDKYNPFCVELFSQECSSSLKPLVPGQFSIITVFEGDVSISNDKQTMHFMGGESGFIPSSQEYKIQIQKKFQDDPCVLIFALQSGKN